MIQIKTRAGFSPKGFTLIELLVVVSIIAILTGIILVVVNPNKLRSQARDAQRVNDLRAIQSALEQYYTNTGRYPFSGSSACSAYGWEVVNTAANSCLITSLSVGVDKVVNSLPIDPLNGTGADPCVSPGQYRYNYRAYDDPSNVFDRKRYILTSIMENPSVVGTHTCDSTGLTNWAVFGCGSAVAGCYGIQNPN